jgi:excinuclease UvrABC helicase subunit UvrB
MISLLEKTGDDVKKYASLVTTGQFYEYLSKEFNKHLSKDMQLTRSQVKKEVLKIFFSDNRYLNHPDAWQKRIFKQLFPTVYQIFEALKQGKKNRLALILQSIEREIVISKICKRIATEYPNMVIYTIHDCIVSTKGNELIIKSIMEDEINRLTDFKPILSIESWE